VYQTGSAVKVIRCWSQVDITECKLLISSSSLILTSDFFILGGMSTTVRHNTNNTSHETTHHAQTKYKTQRIASSGMLRLVALVGTDVSEELSASIIRVTRKGELGKTLALTSNRLGISSQRASVASYS
jgi:hypothetical protein